MIVGYRAVTKLQHFRDTTLIVPYVPSLTTNFLENFMFIPSNFLRELSLIIAVTEN